jgi:tRNA dimethylallyltransferase
VAPALYLDAVLRGYRLIEVPPDPALRSALATAATMRLCAPVCGASNPSNTTPLICWSATRLVRAIEIAEGERTAATELPRFCPQVRPLVLGMRWERAELRRRIDLRLQRAIGTGHGR